MSWTTLEVAEWISYVDETYECEVCGTMPIIDGTKLHKKCHICKKHLLTVGQQTRGFCNRHNNTKFIGEDTGDSSFVRFTEVKA